MAEKPTQPKMVETEPPEKNPTGIEGAPELRFSLPSITQEKQPLTVNKTAVYFFLLFLFCLAAVPVIFYFVTGQNPIDALKNKIAPTPQIPVKTIAQPKVTIEVEKTANGNVLIVRWDNLPSGTA